MRRQPIYSGPYRINPQPPLDFAGELTVDLFAGGGGASTGMEWALGRSPDIAVNHNRKAVLMHQINHPHTKHYCESVFDVVPQEVCGGRPVGHLWMSPDCTHFSKAKGSKPVSKRVRGLAWVGKRWAATVRPRVIFLENVEEFQTWGPLVRINGNMHPCKKRAGRTFRTFVRELQRLGYEVEWRTMRACDYGAPTIRKRLFLVARCDGQPIIWPEPTHGDPKSLAVQAGELKPWRTAAECIDWSIPCPSIFDRKKPLAENTLRRIARGIQRYVIDNPEPFIVPFTCGVGGRAGQSRPRKVTEPAATITTKADTIVVSPTIIGAGGSTYAGKPVSVDQPFGTLTTENHKAVATAVLAPSLTEHANGSNQRTFPTDEPLRTQCAQVKGGHFALQSAMRLKHYGGVVGTAVDQPAGTITTQDHHAIGAATLEPIEVEIPIFNDSGYRPLDNATEKVTVYRQAATLVQTGYGERPGQAPRVPHLNTPLGTAVAGGVKHAVAAAHLIRHFGKSVGNGADEPIATVTAGGSGKTGIVTSNLLKLRGTCKDGQKTDEPMPTVTAGGTHVAEVRAFLTQYYGCSEEQGLRNPLNTVTTKDRFGLVTVRGEVYQIADIGMRMLKPRELYRAQGFPDDYVIDYVLDEGKITPLTVTDQVKFVGNSVSPWNAYALIAANVGTEQRRVAA